MNTINISSTLRTRITTTTVIRIHYYCLLVLVLLFIFLSSNSIITVSCNTIIVGTSSSNSNNNKQRFRTSSVPEITNLLLNTKTNSMNRQQQQQHHCKRLLRRRRQQQQQQQQQLGQYHHFNYYNQPTSILSTTTAKAFQFTSSCQYEYVDTSTLLLLSNTGRRQYYTITNVPWMTTTTSTITTSSLAFAFSSSRSTGSINNAKRRNDGSTGTCNTIQSLIPVQVPVLENNNYYNRQQLHTLQHHSTCSNYESKFSSLFNYNKKSNNDFGNRISSSTTRTRTRTRSDRSTSTLINRYLSTQPIVFDNDIVDQHELDDNNNHTDISYDLNNDTVTSSSSSSVAISNNLIEEMLKDQETILQQQQQQKQQQDQQPIQNDISDSTTTTSDTSTDADSSIDSSILQLLDEKGIKSRPKPKGNWDPIHPIKWSENFGRRSSYYENTILKNLICLQPGDDGYYDVSNMTVKDCTLVRTKEQAQIVLQALYNADTTIFHACDTEVMDIDLKSVGPVGNGYVTCLSMYSGPDFDYGLGDGPGTSLFIDNLDDSCGLLQEFKDWFEDERYLKVWHNYGFDRHVMYNEGINVLGFGGDTMHMARLLDTSRKNGYSLESLSNDRTGRRKRPMKEIFGIPRTRKDGSAGTIIDLPPVEVLQRTPKYRKSWIRYSCFDAESTWNLRTLFQGDLERCEWAPPNGFNENDNDTDMHDDNKKLPNLYDYYQMHMRPFAEVLTDMERRGVRVDAGSYLANVEVQARKDREYHLEVFRQWAKSKIGTAGLALNVASALQMRIFLFGGSVHPKTKDVTEIERTFPMTRDEIPVDAYEEYQQLRKQGITDAATVQAGLDDDDKEDQLQYLEQMKGTELKIICKDCGLKSTGTKIVLIERIREHYSNLATATDDDSTGTSSESIIPIEQNDGFDKMKKQDLMDAAIARGLPTHGTKKDIIDRIRLDIKELIELDAAIAGCQSNNNNKNNYNSGTSNGLKINSLLVQAAGKDGNGELAKFIAELKAKENIEPKYTDVTIRSIGLIPEKFTSGGVPSVTSDVLRTLAGDPFADPPKRGKAHDIVGEEGCKALFSLCAIGSIDTMITNFLTSLQELADDQSRVHCSLNLNTETGRLSSRRPNLQNQPALEKDKYKIRKAFQASPGNKLIVADYGQLELRILASLTNCHAMIDAFASGGDFHSRTALDMFDHVRKAVDDGECLLEWDYNKGSPPKPLLKDLFASERRKAKTLNFSIAYGKTAHGLSQDWGVKRQEAEDMLQAWYNARVEVKEWQETTKKIAKKTGLTTTLMGRRRQLPLAMDRDKKLMEQGFRASINTPIQGGAADIAMMAMNKINKHEKLKDLGWILLLQVHDEVMLEGPEETAEEAFDIVKDCMISPWVYGLRQTAVPLTVDGSWEHTNWYEAK